MNQTRTAQPTSGAGGWRAPRGAVSLALAGLAIATALAPQLASGAPPAVSTPHVLRLPDGGGSTEVPGVARITMVVGPTASTAAAAETAFASVHPSVAVPAHMLTATNVARPAATRGSYYYQYQSVTICAWAGCWAWQETVSASVRFDSGYAWVQNGYYSCTGSHSASWCGVINNGAQPWYRPVQVGGNWGTGWIRIDNYGDGHHQVRWG